MLNSSLENKINSLKPDFLDAKTNEKFWRKHFIRFEESGLSRKKYCQVNSVSYSRFQYWRQKLLSDKSIKAVPVILAPKVPATAKSKPVALCQLSLKQGHELMIYDRGLMQMLLAKLL